VLSNLFVCAVTVFKVQHFYLLCAQTEKNCINLALTKMPRHQTETFVIAILKCYKIQ